MKIVLVVAVLFMLGACSPDQEPDKIPQSPDPLTEEIRGLKEELKESLVEFEAAAATRAKEDDELIRQCVVTIEDARARIKDAVGKIETTTARAEAAETQLKEVWTQLETTRQECAK